MMIFLNITSRIRSQSKPAPVEESEAIPAVVANEVKNEGTAPAKKVKLPTLERCPHCGSKHKPYFIYRSGNNYSISSKRFGGGEAYEWKYATLRCRDYGHEVTVYFPSSSKPYQTNERSLR